MLAAMTVSDLEEVKGKEVERKEKEEEALLSHCIGCKSLATMANAFEENLSLVVLSTTVRKTSQLKQEVW